MSVSPTFDQLAIGFVLALVVAALCWRARLLALSGAVAAAAVGTAVVGGGGWPAGVALLTFFLSSSMLSRWRKGRKASMRFEKGSRRDAGQVLANGGAAAVLIVAAVIAPAYREILTIGFLSALAEANADTWATEIGAASGAVPRLITTLRPALAGRSGAISAPGTAAALAGAVLVAVLAGLFVPHHEAVRAAAIVAISGFAGSIADSLLGATVQAQYSVANAGTDSVLTESRAEGSRLVCGLEFVGNDVVNLASTIIAALLGIAAQYLA